MTTISHARTPSPTGFIIAAPRSGGGKTTVTLALIAALTRRGLAIAPAKVGPDYIDPRYHEAAARHPSVNLDAWAMDAPALRALAAGHGRGRDHLVVEGVMGLFDGARVGGAMANGEASADWRSESRHGTRDQSRHGGHGATADIARALGLPVILVLDGAGQGQSVAAVAAGFAGLDPGVRIAGVILNTVAGARHEAMLRDALARIAMPCLGALPRAAALVRPSRHLGLVQAEEAELDAFLETAADLADDHVNLTALAALAEPLPEAGDATPLLPHSLPPPLPPPLPPLGNRIAVADDVAFRFAYNHVLEGWRAVGASLHPFSPLADEGPDAQADAVFLPGGYPELHAGRLASNGSFLGGLRSAAGRGARVYGECGGYMVLGRGLVDADGARHAMSALLDLETSFAERRRHLGYRHARIASGAAWLGGAAVRGHEYHYTSVLEERGQPFLRVLTDGSGMGSPHEAGLRAGSVFGSFVHLIAQDRTSDAA